MTRASARSGSDRSSSRLRSKKPSASRTSSPVASARSREGSCISGARYVPVGERSRDGFSA